MLKRQGAHAAGKWSFPGGWIDRSDSSLLDVAKREALEETGLTLFSARQVGATTEDHPDLGVRTVTIYFIAGCLNWTGEPTIKEPAKCSEMGWFDLNNLPAEVFPALMEGVKFVKSYLDIFRARIEMERRWEEEQHFPGTHSLAELLPPPSPQDDILLIGRG